MTVAASKPPAFQRFLLKYPGADLGRLLSPHPHHMTLPANQPNQSLSKAVKRLLCFSSSCREVLHTAR